MLGENEREDIEWEEDVKIGRKEDGVFQGRCLR